MLWENESPALRSLAPPATPTAETTADQHSAVSSHFKPPDHCTPFFCDLPFLAGEGFSTGVSSSSTLMTSCPSFTPGFSSVIWENESPSLRSSALPTTPMAEATADEHSAVSSPFKPPDYCTFVFGDVPFLAGGRFSMVVSLSSTLMYLCPSFKPVFCLRFVFLKFQAGSAVLSQ